jgi:ribonucleoside-diphosphate reductase alpha chain
MEYEPFYWLNQDSRLFLSRGYLKEGETAEERIKDIALAAEKKLNKSGFADKFFDYMSRGWFSLSSPVWSNFGRERGMPISCFGGVIQDNLNDILWSVGEVGKQSQVGGGTSGFFGKIRPRGSVVSSGGESDGSVSFMRIFDTAVDVCKQASVRRGSYAAYLNIDHEDIDEFLKIKSEGNPIQHLFTGVCVSDEWMQSMIDGDKEKRKTWSKVLKSRSEIGLPYIFFSDTVNNNNPEAYKKTGRTVHASNLCSETTLSSSDTESFVCCLSSMNLLHFEEWKDTDAVEVLCYFLDSVMTEFIDKSEGEEFLKKSNEFAKNQRAIGLGVFGFHSYLQSKMVAFESLEAMMINHEIFENLNNKSLAASQKAAKEYGEPEILKGLNLRWVTRLAIAPTTSSAFIIGQTSQSVEPEKSNFFNKELAKHRVIIKNKYLEKLLEEKGKNIKKTWDSIAANNGSVQQLDFLTQEEKDVFRTFQEISQRQIIDLAAQRQKFIDQSQSLNLSIHPDTPVKEINELMIHAWKSGIKTLYYQHSSSAAQQFLRKLNQCVSCEG